MTVDRHTTHRVSQATDPRYVANLVRSTARLLERVTDLVDQVLEGMPPDEMADQLAKIHDLTHEAWDAATETVAEVEGW